MKNKYLKETTSNWKTHYKIPQHTYIFVGKNSKVSGYIKENTTKEILFSKPRFFDKRNRTFKEIKLYENTK